MLRAIADKLHAMGLKDLSTLVHEEARKREAVAKEALNRVVQARTFERLCFGCAPAADAPSKWQPMTTGLCQNCGTYADLMGFKRGVERELG